MHPTVIVVKKDAKGCFGIQGKRAYCFSIEADSVVKDNGAFDPLYRISQDMKEIAILKDGLPVGRIKYSRRTGKWSTTFMMDESVEFKVQLNVKSFPSLKDYLLAIRDNDIHGSNFRENSRMLPYRCFNVPTETGTVLGTKGLETKLFLLDENITHEEATHGVSLVDDQGNHFLKRQVVLLSEEDEFTCSDIARLYQLEAYHQLTKEGIDPYVTLADTVSIELEDIAAKTIKAYALERNRYEQPVILRSSRHK